MTTQILLTIVFLPFPTDGFKFWRISPLQHNPPSVIPIQTQLHTFTDKGRKGTRGRQIWWDIPKQAHKYHVSHGPVLEEIRFVHSNKGKLLIIAFGIVYMVIIASKISGTVWIWNILSHVIINVHSFLISYVQFLLWNSWIPYVLLSDESKVITFCI